MSITHLNNLLAQIKSQSAVLRFVLLLVLASALLSGLLLAFMSMTDGGSVSLHFYVAFGLGAFLSLLLGFGLMSLIFYSARRGFDEPVKVDATSAELDPQSRS